MAITFNYIKVQQLIMHFVKLRNIFSVDTKGIAWLILW